MALVLSLSPAAAAESFSQTLHDARLAFDTGDVESSVELYEKALAMRTASAQRLAPERSWAYVRLGIEALNRRGAPGNHHVQLVVDVPKSLTEEKEDLLRQLAELDGNDVREKGFWKKLFG